MTDKRFGKKVFAILLTFMMALSMTGYTFVEAFAEDGEDTLTNEEFEGEEGVLGEEDGEEGGSVTDELGGGVTIEVTGEEEQEVTDPEQDPEQEPEQEPEAVLRKAAALEQIKVRASRDGNFITAMWTKVEDAAYYMVYLNEDTAGVKVLASEKCKHIFDLGVTDLAVQTVKVEAYREITVEPEPAVEDEEDTEEDENT